MRIRPRRDADLGARADLGACADLVRAGEVEVTFTSGRTVRERVFVAPTGPGSPCEGSLEGRRAG